VIVSQRTHARTDADATTGNDAMVSHAARRINGVLRAGTRLVGDSVHNGSSSTGRVVAISMLDGSREWETTRRDAVISVPDLTSHGLAVLSSDPALFCD